MARERRRQLAYSDVQGRMHAAAERRQKATKILRILEHFLGPGGLEGARVLDLGCSLGFFVEAAARAGGRGIGADIDIGGLARARADRDPRCSFVLADGEALPFADGSIDVVVFNHIYEHVVDADAALAEIRRVLTPDGVVYLGLANRLGVVEPHYGLPFLSWLPRPLADRYVRASGRADHYHERLRLLPGLRRLVAGLAVHDYTYSVLAHPELFGATDVVPPRAAAVVRAVPAPARAVARPFLPTYLWVATPGRRTPAGPRLTVPPDRLRAGSGSSGSRRGVLRWR